MAQVLEKDPATYSKEREGFLRDLQHFHDTKCTPFKRLPTIGGREVDLYLLYTLVTTQGGWLKVNSKNAWPELLHHFHLPSKCVNGSIALKQIYLRYLDRWEKVHFLGEEGDRGSDDDEEGRHKKCSARALHMVPLTYNYNQHNVIEANREFNHLSTNLHKPTDYDRLALSLISPLPNEQDFAINVCTLLSNDGKHTLKVEKNPRLLDYLLAHAGVYNHASTRKLFLHHYNVVRKHPIHNFWDEVLDSKETLQLIESAAEEIIVEKKATPADNKETPKEENGTKTKPVECATSSTVVTTSNASPEVCPMDVDVNNTGNTSEQQQQQQNVISVDDSDDNELFNLDDNSNRKRSRRKFDIDQSDKDLFCLDRTLGTQDYLGQRVLQIATILRNLSFIEDNVPVLAKNRTFVRFILLCSSSRWNYLKNLGLDMLGNIAGEFIVRDLTQDKLAAALLTIVTRGLDSQDRLWCLSSLEMLNKLSQNDKNEDVLLRCLEATVYEKVCVFLTIHDVMLLIYTLECLYSLSSLGERSCNLIINNHGVVDTLVSLVTVEGKSYGPKACIGMKLVETVSGAAPSGAAAAAASGAQSQVGGSTPAAPMGKPGAQAGGKSVGGQASKVTPLSAMAVKGGGGGGQHHGSGASATSTPLTTTAATSKGAIGGTPVRTIQMAPQRLMAVSPSPPMPTAVPVSSSSITTTPVVGHTISLTPQQLIQQQHAHQQAIHENEQFALSWLRATYEPFGNSRINSQELYKHYINSCTKIGRRGVISPLHFPRCVRSVFGGTVGPNPMKPTNPKEAQFYDGIKALAHPHLSQALLGSGAPTSVSPAALAVVATPTNQQATTQTQQGANTSLIKSLLANKVNECLTTVSMRTAECQKVVQVAERQQRLLAQQTQINVNSNKTPKIEQQHQQQQNVKMNGARQLFGVGGAVLGTAEEDPSLCDPAVSSTTTATNAPFANAIKGKKEPPQPPPPPLAPLTATQQLRMVRPPVKIDNEDSDSIGNNSMASSIAGVGGISSTEEGDNSLTSFEGLLNGVPNVDHHLNDDSNSKDSSTIEITRNKPLRLADLLEKKFEKTPPTILNGSLCKDLKMGAKCIDLVENHIEKALIRVKREEATEVKHEIIEIKEEEEEEPEVIEIKVDGVQLKRDERGLKRVATGEDGGRVDHKKPCLVGALNGNAPSPAPSLESAATSSSSASVKEEDCGLGATTGSASVSNAAAKLFADMAADILEDEDEEQLLQEAAAAAAVTQHQHQTPATITMDQVAMGTSPSGAVGQLMMDNGAGQMIIATQPRQIIMSQQNASIKQIAPAVAQPTHQTVIVQNSAPSQQQLQQQQQQLQHQQQQQQQLQQQQQHRSPSVVLQQTNSGQILLSSQGLQGQVQFVTASNQTGQQYVLQTSANGAGAYMVAQPQTAMVHGQPQTVLVAQTAQQHAAGGGAKTIIILQQQPSGAQATHHQKVVVTPQGQQVVVTQVPRPVIHTSVGNLVQQTPTVIKTNPGAVAPSSSSSSNSVGAGFAAPPNAVVATVGTSSPSMTISTTAAATAANVATPVRTTKQQQEEAKPKMKIKVIRDTTHPFICEWNDCIVTTKFRSANEVYLHACEAHVPDVDNEEVICQWDRCDNLKRKKFSLMTHLHDKHCNTEAMKQALVKRKTQPNVGKPAPPPAPSTSPHPGYAPDAALHAIKRHALEFVNPKELQDDNEGPVTKSIRLTASLILRNLVIYSGNCRRYLKHYESHLANVALSNVESSRTIAQILYDMNEGSNHR